MLLPFTTYQRHDEPTRLPSVALSPHASLADRQQTTRSYIQTAQPDASGGFACKHGAPECAGNRQQLCAEAHIPASKSFGVFLSSFLLCQWDGNVTIGDPHGTRACLKRAGVGAGTIAEVEACAKGAEGARLMAESAAAVAAREIVNSCTVFIGGRRRCVRDGGAWRDCPGGSGDADFARSVCEAFKEQTGRDAPACAAAGAKAWPQQKQQQPEKQQPAKQQPQAQTQRQPAKGGAAGKKGAL